LPGCNQHLVDVNGVSVGKLSFCPNHIGTGINIAVGHAEYMVAYADATLLIPDGLSYAQAAPIFCLGVLCTAT